MCSNNIKIIFYSHIILDMTIENFCECDNCVNNVARYKTIKQGNAWWLTISPPRREGSPSKLYEADKSTMLKNIKRFARSFICVAEIANDRLHYHIFYDLSNKIAKFKFIGGIAHTLRYMYRDCKGQPKEGAEWEDDEGVKHPPIHYLFKDVEEIRDDYGIEDPITTELDYKLRKKKPKHNDLIDPLELKPIPEWMLANNDD